MLPNIPILLILSLFWVSKTSYGQLRYYDAAVWKGGAFDKSHGGVYLRLDISSKLRAAKANGVIVKLINPQTLHVYSLRYQLLKGKKSSATVFKIPSGQYRVLQAGLIASGKFYNFKGPSREYVSVLPNRISDGGVWYLSSPQSMVLRFSKTPKKSLRDIAKKLRSRAGGGTRTVQKAKESDNSKAKEKNLSRNVKPGIRLKARKFEGNLGRKKRLKKLSDGGFDSPADMRAAYSYQQTIALVYKVSTSYNNYYSKHVAKGISAVESKIRECYADALQTKGDFKGAITYRFSYENKSLKLKLAKDTVRDKKMTECVYWQIAALNIGTRKNITGSIKLNFSNE